MKILGKYAKHLVGLALASLIIWVALPSYLSDRLAPPAFTNNMNHSASAASASQSGQGTVDARNSLTVASPLSQFKRLIQTSVRGAYNHPGTSRAVRLFRPQCPVIDVVKADAGLPQTVKKDSEVFLHGAVKLSRIFADCSSAVIGSVSFKNIKWEFLADKGNIGTLVGANTLNPHFKADKQGVYHLRLTGQATYKPTSSSANRTFSFGDVVVITVDDSYDLFVEAIEVTQAIQTGAAVISDMKVDAVPLVQDKKTLVRVYVGVRGPTGTLVPKVEGDLHVLREDETEITPSPRLLTPYQRIDVQPASLYTRRGNLDSSLNFVLNSSQTTGTIILKATVDPSQKSMDHDYGNNEKRIKVTFQKTRPFNLWWVAIRYTGLTPALFVTTADYTQTVSYLKRTYPISDNAIRTKNYIGPDIGVGYALNGTKGWDRLLQDIEDFTDCGNFFCDSDFYGSDPHIFGIVPSGTPTCDASGCISGYGEISGPGDEVHAAGVAGCPGPGPDVCNVSGEVGGKTMAQEVAHNYGRKHADSGAGEGNSDDGFRPVGGMIGDFGFDFASNTVISPTAYDFMTYRAADPNGMWVSPYTYRALFNNFKTSGQSVTISTSQPQQSSSAPQEFLLISGIVSPTEGELRPMYRVVRAISPNPVPPGNFSIELVNEPKNQLLYEQRFTPIGLSHEDDRIGIFRMYIPWQPETTHILLKRKGSATVGDVELQRIPVSPHTPSVNFIETLPGGELGGTKLIRWSAVDDDNDLLTAMLQYSADGGQNWRPVAISQTEPVFSLDTSRLPGSNNAYLRILVTDGVNTGVAQTGPFVVPDKIPQAMIETPENQQSFSAGAPVFLQGSAMDSEDGALTDGSLSWESDQDGPLGSGAVLQVTQLSPGQHTITFKAKDSKGQTATDQVIITIIPVIPPIQIVSLAVSAIAGGQVPPDTTIKVTTPSRTIDANAPLSAAFDQGSQVQVEAPQEARLGNEVFVFKEWSIDDTRTSSDRVISLTLNSNTSLIAKYQFAFQLPTITCPANVMVIAPRDQTTAVVNYPPPTVGGPAGTTATCTPPSGFRFPIGITTVTCTATDISGRQASCTFTVTVKAFKCDAICFRSPQYWLLNINRLPRGTVLIGGVNFNTPVSTSDVPAIQLALQGGGALTPLQRLNQEFVAAQLSLELAGGHSSPPVFNAFWSQLRCYGFSFAPITLSNGFTLTPDSMLNDLFEQARSVIRENRVGDMLPLVRLFDLLNGNDLLGRCASSSERQSIPGQPPTIRMQEFTGPEEGFPPKSKGRTNVTEVPFEEGPLTDALETQIHQAALQDTRVSNLLGARFGYIGTDEIERAKDRGHDPGLLATRVTFFSHTNNVAVEALLQGLQVVSVSTRPGYQPPEGKDEIEAAIALARNAPRLRDKVQGLKGYAILMDFRDPDQSETHRVLYVVFSLPEEDQPQYFAIVDLTSQKVLDAGPET